METAQAAQERVESDLAFHPGERRSDAEMRAVPKSEVWVGMALNVKPIRLDKLRRVAIGRAEHAHDLLAGLDRLATDVEIEHRDAYHELKGRLVAQRLLDGRAGQSRVLAKQAL